MKVKEVNRTANIAWSPAPQYPIYLAAGTAAQQLDATFSTNAALEIFALNLSSGDGEMPLKGTVASEHRFHKLVWGSHGMDSSDASSGLLIGGSDNGIISIYDAKKIVCGDADDAIVFESSKHTGPVQALDFNPFKTSLLASGASDSEIYIWDLTNPGNPLTPGSKTLPPDNISCVAWNRQVQHILASGSPCGRCVVWDLRKNEPIIKVSDQSAMIRCKAVEWHPDVATQMVLASEDDRYPVIQMWDLRFATSPMKVLEGHQRGILSIAWCPQDPDLLMSCAKDNRILCWNPNTQEPGGEIVYELPTTAQWSFDIAWCPRNPAMVCSSSFDGHVSVFSLMGGGTSSQDFNQQKVMSAFDADDPFTAQIRQGQQQQLQQQQKAAPTSTPLKKPPKWLRRPCGASFAFGGKLISFGQTKDSPIAQVNISQVTTEQELVNRSYELEGALASGSFIQYCNSKVESSTQELERTLWSFLKINFEREPRRHFLTLLGYDPMELSKKVASSYASSSASSNQGGVDAEELVQKMQLISTGEAGSKQGQTKPGQFVKYTAGTCVFSIWRGFGAPMRCLAFSMAVAMAMRASGIREGPEGHTTVTTCSERVAMVLDNVYGRWFARKIDQLLLDDPFSTSQDTKEDLLKRLQKSMLFHCEFFESQKSCDGVRNARFQERMGKRNERVFPAKISPKDSSCFKSITDPGPERDRCVMVQCYRELVEKNCRAVVSQSGQSKVEDMRLHEKCL